MASTGEPFGLFWDSENGDRTYSAASFEYWLKKFFTSGVFNGDLQVQATSGMTVKVGAGYANVDGKVKFWNAEFNLTLSAANSTYPRIDTIVITRDNVNRQITCEVVTGAYTADEPQPTAPVRNPEIYQLVLAQIYVAAGATGITQSDITDTRTDTDLCGYITGTVTEMDFSQFTAQFEAYFAEYKLGFEADMSEWESSQQASYATWFNSIVQQYISDKSDWDSWYADLQATLHMLPQDSAEYLQVEINELRDLSSGSIINIDTIEPTLIGQAVTLSSEDGLQTKSAVFEKYRNKLENEGESETINGITFTVNADGTVTANGTASAEARFYINESFTAANGDVLNGCPENGSAVSYQLRVGSATDDTAVGIDVGRGYTMSAGTYKISINIASGRTVNNLVFKPMVRDAADSAEYEKYSSAKAHATIKGVTFVGNLKLASTDSIYTAKATITTPYYSLYHVDMEFWIANVDIQGDTTLYGATVTVKNSDDVAVGTVTLSSLDGTGSIELTKPDTYTFNYTYSSVDYSVSQVVDTDGATYSLNLYTWKATVNIQGDENLYGATVTVKDSNNTTVGTVTLSSVDGTTTWYARQADTYTFSTTYEGETITETLVVTAEITYSVELATGFMWTRWVTLGGLDPTDYTDLEDVFADEVAVRRLMTIHASADYLIDCVTDKLNDIDAFCANDTAMKWIGLRDYVCDGLTAITGVEAKFLASEYWERYLKDHVPVMKSNTVPYGTASAYQVFDGQTSTSASGTDFSYNFTNPICVKKFECNVNGGTLQGSNDGSTWTTISTPESNTTYYLYYRVHFTSSKTPHTIQFYGRSLDVSVPAMISNTAPYGEVIATSLVGNSDTNATYKAYDNNSSTWGAASTTADTNDKYIGYGFGRPMLVRFAKVVSHYSTYTASNCVIQGSNDKLTWNTCSDTQNITGNDVAFNFVVDSDVAYKYWRVYAPTLTASGKFLIEILQFYGVDYSEREFAEGSTMKYLYDHGLEIEPMTVYQSGTGQVTKRAEEVYEYAGNPSTGGQGNVASYRNTTKIDLSPYNVVRYKETNFYNQAHLTILASDTMVYNADTWNVAFGSMYSGTTGKANWGGLDISSVNGEYYVYFAAGYGGGSYVSLNEMWLE